IGFDAILVLLKSHGADALLQLGSSADGDIRQTLIEFGSQGQVSGRPSFVVSAMIRERLVVEPDPMEWTINEVRRFRLEIGKPIECERIDPARAGLMPWKDSFVDQDYA